MIMTQKQIQLVNIEKELKRLWDEELGKDKIHACLFTLIIYSVKGQRSSFCEQLIQKVISKFPCRVILIMNDEKSGEEYLKTSVKTETLGEGNLKVFCEMIQIDVAGSLLKRVPYITLPQIVPDLPVYLLWTQDPASERVVLPQLAPYAKRIIFDPEGSTNLQTLCQSILELIQKRSSEVGDLTWSSTAGWRQVIASTFDTPDLLVALAQTKILRIQYCRKSISSKQSYRQAAYLQAWLAGQMGWKLEGAEETEGHWRMAYRRLSYEIAVILTPQENGELEEGDILSLEQESHRNRLHFVFQRHPKTEQVVIQRSDQESCQLPYSSHLGSSTRGQEIINEIFSFSTSSHYSTALQILSQTPWGK